MYRLARHVTLAEQAGEHLLVSRTPLCVLRLNRSLYGLVARGVDGPIAPVSRAEQDVLEQLAGKGFVERLREQSDLPTDPATVSIVIPVKDRENELARCLASLDRITYPKALIQVIVVDDGSKDRSASVAALHGAKVVPSGGIGRGPAAARNVGARAATGEILAFIDSDCTASAGWLDELLPSFNDPRLAAVGGYVDGMCRESAVDRYESAMSSLSLGSRERTASSGDDTFYLPSCNLLVRRDLFHGVGGFRDEMHVGEDVDLTWRLRDQGWAIGYLPVGRIYHEHRSTVRSFMSRRFDYGTSEGTLQRLHPNRRKRMVIPPLLALLMTLGLAAPFTGGWSLVIAIGVLALDVMAVKARLMSRKVSVGLPELFAGRLRALGSLVYYLCFHLVRYYSLLIIAGALFFPLLWLPFAAALGCAGRVDYSVRKPEQPFAPFIAIYALEQIAYGAGVFWGCLNRKTFASYRVVVLRQGESPA